MKKIKAFSLVELIVSVVIIAVITAAFVPVLTKSINVNRGMKSSGLDTQCANNCCIENKNYCSSCNANACQTCNLICADDEVLNVPKCRCTKLANINIEFPQETVNIIEGCSKYKIIQESNDKIMQASATCPIKCAKQRLVCEQCQTGLELVKDGAQVKCENPCADLSKTGVEGCMAAEASARTTANGFERTCQCVSCQEGAHIEKDANGNKVCMSCGNGQYYGTQIIASISSGDTIAPKCGFWNWWYCGLLPVKQTNPQGNFTSGNTSLGCYSCEESMEGCISCTNGYTCTQCKEGYNLTNANGVTGCARIQADNPCSYYGMFGYCLRCKQGYINVFGQCRAM